jgi:hypothetical protein
LYLKSIVGEASCNSGVGEGVTSFLLAKLKSGHDQVPILTRSTPPYPLEEEGDPIYCQLIDFYSLVL